MPEYIFNTTALSNFAVAGRLDLLETRYRGAARITMEVVDELRKGVNAGYTALEPALQGIKSVNPDGWLRVLVPLSPEEHRLRAEFDHLVDPGEASCLALAVSRGLTFVTDDRAARRLASGRGVSLTGTLGILIALVRDDNLSLAEANAMLAEMISRRYRSPVDRLDGLI
jgi:predicted nucleic acid-binding protein